MSIALNFFDTLDSVTCGEDEAERTATPSRASSTVRSPFFLSLPPPTPIISPSRLFTTLTSSDFHPGLFPRNPSKSSSSLPHPSSLIFPTRSSTSPLLSSSQDGSLNPRLHRQLVSSSAPFYGRSGSSGVPASEGEGPSLVGERGGGNGEGGVGPGGGGGAGW